MQCRVSAVFGVTVSVWLWATEAGLGFVLFSPTTVQHHQHLADSPPSPTLSSHRRISPAPPHFTTSKIIMSLFVTLPGKPFNLAMVVLQHIYARSTRVEVSHIGRPEHWSNPCSRSLWKRTYLLSYATTTFTWLHAAAVSLARHSPSSQEG
ncbi:hypothetical protein BDV06DRAFT_166550 [Aspergillus oleicola]